VTKSWEFLFSNVKRYKGHWDVIPYWALFTIASWAIIIAHRAWSWSWL